MMFSMTRNAKYFKVMQRIVSSVFVDMMNFKLTFFFKTSIALIRKFLKSIFSIKIDTINKSRIVFSYRWFCRKMTFFPMFNVFTFFRAMFPRLNITRLDKIGFKTFFTDLFHKISSVVIVKTSFAAKYISIIKTIYLKKLPTLFAAFRFPDFCSRGRITRFTAVNLPFVIARNLLITMFAEHVGNDVRNTLTSQSYRRNYG